MQARAQNDGQDAPTQLTLVKEFLLTNPLLKPLESIYVPGNVQMIVGTFEKTGKADCCRASCDVGRWTAQLLAAGATAQEIVAIPCDNFRSALSVGVVTDHDLAKAMLGVQPLKDQQAGDHRIYYAPAQNTLVTISLDGKSLAEVIEAMLVNPPGYMQVARLRAEINFQNKATCRITKLQVTTPKHHAKMHAFF